jgi:ribonuclease HII
MYKVIGVDEAGKGPVLGSLFIGFCIINLERKEDVEGYQNHLRQLGVTDSKKLSDSKRSQLYEILKTKSDIKFVQLTPNILNIRMQTESLNDIEISAIVTILNAEKPQMVFLDALTSKPKEYGEHIRNKLKFPCEIISENKADATYPIVGAASIIAKELREQEVAQIKHNLKLDCGSGYPADPKTREFVKRHGKTKEFEFLFRKEWATYKELTGLSSQKKLTDF